jgi:hypothetical protein
LGQNWRVSTTEVASTNERSKSALGQVRVNLRGLWTIWPVRVGLAGAVALLAVVAAAAGGDAPGPYRVLRIVASLSDASSAILWLAAIGFGFLLVFREARSGYEVFAGDRPVSALDYTIGKAGAGFIAFAAVCLLLQAEMAALLLASGGGYVAGDEFRHLVVVAAGVLPFLFLTEIFATIVPPYLAPLPVLVVVAMSRDFALDRGRAMTGLLEVTPGVSFEKAAYGVLPRELIDPMTREILVARSTYLRDYPSDDTAAVFGGNLVLVSQPGDYIYWGIYLLALLALLYGVSLLRARGARQIIHVPARGRYAEESRPG